MSGESSESNESMKETSTIQARNDDWGKWGKMDKAYVTSHVLRT